uniref:Uncharacterized protein n=1 Tax=Podarcis muralis TaxID=64176 RepID=A0A670JKS0_PODMU
MDLVPKRLTSTFFVPVASLQASKAFEEATTVAKILARLLGHSEEQGARQMRPGRTHLAGAPRAHGQPRPSARRFVGTRSMVLLAGEPWGAESGQQVLSSFAHHVLPTTGGGSQEAPGAEPTEKAQQQQQQQQQLGTQSPPCTSSVAPSGQLTFFLCRAASLRERAARLREVLQGVRDQSRGSPAALVGVIVQPRPEEEYEALSRLEELLREVFEVEGTCSMEIHTAVFAPGRPDGALELRRVGRRSGYARGGALHRLQNAGAAQASCCGTRCLWACAQGRPALAKPGPVSPGTDKCPPMASLVLIPRKACLLAT